MLRLVLGKLRMLGRDAEAGRVLGSRAGTGNLSTFRCLTVGDREFRIVYRIEAGGEICVIWVISARSEERCYHEAVSRLAAIGNHPGAQELGQALAMLKPRTARRVVQVRRNQPPEERV